MSNYKVKSRMMWIRQKAKKNSNARGAMEQVDQWGVALDAMEPAGLKLGKNFLLYVRIYRPKDAELIKVDIYRIDMNTNSMGSRSLNFI